MTVQETLYRSDLLSNRSLDRSVSPDEHNIVLDVVGQRVWFRRQEVHLTPREFAVLLYLARSGGRLVPGAEILTAVWGNDTMATDEALRTTIKRLRRKLGDDSKWQRYIVNAWGRGYQLALQATNANATFFMLLSPLEQREDSHRA